MTAPRMTIASTNLRIDTLESKVDAVLRLLQDRAQQAPAPQAPATEAPATAKVTCFGCGKGMEHNRVCQSCARKAGLKGKGRQPNLATITYARYAQAVAETEEAARRAALTVQPLAHLDVAAPAKAKGRTAADHCVVPGCTHFGRKGWGTCTAHKDAVVLPEYEARLVEAQRLVDAQAAHNAALAATIARLEAQGFVVSAR